MHTNPPTLPFFHYCGECVIERAKVANNIIKNREKERERGKGTIMQQSGWELGAWETQQGGYGNG